MTKFIPFNSIPFGENQRWSGGVWMSTDTWYELWSLVSTENFKTHLCKIYQVEEPSFDRLTLQTLTLEALPIQKTLSKTFL